MWAAHTATLPPVNNGTFPPGLYVNEAARRYKRISWLQAVTAGGVGRRRGAPFEERPVKSHLIKLLAHLKRKSLSVEASF